MKDRRRIVSRSRDTAAFTTDVVCFTDPTDFVLSKIFVMWQFFVLSYFLVGAKNSPEQNRHPGDRALCIKNN
ncbi:hypothetical protein J6590_023869 [Homalodisca vitripennis]|nr:hypothetical protein J6590_023869 [Homalodisca vitripennis]